MDTSITDINPEPEPETCVKEEQSPCGVDNEKTCTPFLTFDSSFSALPQEDAFTNAKIEPKCEESEELEQKNDEISLTFDSELGFKSRKRKNSSSEGNDPKRSPYLAFDTSFDALPQESGTTGFRIECDETLEQSEESSTTGSQLSFIPEQSTQTVDENFKDAPEPNPGQPLDNFEEPPQEQYNQDKFEFIELNVISQREAKSIVANLNSSVLELKLILEEVFHITRSQICLISDKRVLSDADGLKSLNLNNGSDIFLIKRYDHQMESASNDPVFYWPSQYTSIASCDFDLSELQKQMQKDFNENPELVKQALMNPATQDLMRDPVRLKSMMLSCPGGSKLLESRLDIADALSNPNTLEEIATISQDPAAVKEMLDKMDAAKNQEAMPTEAKSTSYSQTIPSCENMMKMTLQNPKMLTTMMTSPQYKAMIEGMVANPDWTEKMLLNNPLMAANPKMRQQTKSFLPIFLRQLQDPAYISMMTNPNTLKSLLKVQRGVYSLQKEVPLLIPSMGFQDCNMPGNFNVEFAEEEQSGIEKPNSSEVDPMAIVMERITRQTKDGTIGFLPEERYAKELQLMEKMGFTDKECNINFLTATFGDVDTAVSQLLMTSAELLQAEEVEGMIVGDANENGDL